MAVNPLVVGAVIAYILLLGLVIAFGVILFERTSSKKLVKSSQITSLQHQINSLSVKVKHIENSLNNMKSKISLGSWEITPDEKSKQLNFCYNDSTKKKKYNPIFFKYNTDPKVPGTGQVWAQAINSPGYTKSADWASKSIC
jgi:hypothetical protein